MLEKAEKEKKDSKDLTGDEMNQKIFDIQLPKNNDLPKKKGSPKILYFLSIIEILLLFIYFPFTCFIRSSCDIINNEFETYIIYLFIITFFLLIILHILNLEIVYTQNEVLFKILKFSNFFIILFLFSFMIVTFLQLGKINENKKRKIFNNYPEVIKYFYSNNFNIFFKYIRDNIILIGIFYILEIIIYILRAFFLVKKEFNFFLEFKRVEKIKWNRFDESNECLSNKNYYIKKRKSIFVR